MGRKRRKRKSSKRKRLLKHERNPRPGIEVCKSCGVKFGPHTKRELGYCLPCLERKLLGT